MAAAMRVFGRGLMRLSVPMVQAMAPPRVAMLNPVRSFSVGALQASFAGPAVPLLRATAQQIRGSFFLRNAIVAPAVTTVMPVRSLIRCSMNKGKKKTVKAVVHRFLRLGCGLWLRRQSGYKKRLWRKRPKQRKRLREHILCNKTQSKKLDKMVTSFWKRRTWYIGDPFQMYHDRHNFLP
uniref:large ribosomal subunit protein bL35m isoform X1 n=2 Tax=Myxine glutinosa TaxID=7769 RepID=UPI00358E3C1A